MAEAEGDERDRDVGCLRECVGEADRYRLARWQVDLDPQLRRMQERRARVATVRLLHSGEPFGPVDGQPELTHAGDAELVPAVDVRGELARDLHRRGCLEGHAFGQVAQPAGLTVNQSLRPQDRALCVPEHRLQVETVGRGRELGARVCADRVGHRQHRAADLRAAT